MIYHKQGEGAPDWFVKQAQGEPTMMILNVKFTVSNRFRTSKIMEDIKV